MHRIEDGAPGWFALDRRTALKVSGGSIAALVMGSAAALDAAVQETSDVAGTQFFTTHMAETVGALAEQYWPTTEASAGAIDAGAVVYIDRALGGAYSAYQNVYRVGIDWLDAVANEQHQADFASLEAGQQLELLTALFDESIAYPAVALEATPSAATPSSATPVVAPDLVATPEVDEGGAQVDDGKGNIIAGGTGPQVDSLLGFLNVVRVHTMEGLFADPVHGGNKDFAGWKAVGYPGPYVYFSEEQQQSIEPLDLPLQSIADL